MILKALLVKVLLGQTRKRKKEIGLGGIRYMYRESVAVGKE